MSREKIFRTSAGFTFIAFVFALPSLGIDFSQEPTRLGEGHASTVAFNPDGTLLAAAHRTDPQSDIYSTQVVILWDPQTQEKVSILEIENIPYVTFSPDGTLLALGGDGRSGNKIHLWDVAGQTQAGLMQSPTRWGLSCLAFSPDGKTLASCGSGSAVICLWDVQTKQQVGTLRGHTGTSIPCVAFSPDGRLLVSGGRREDEAIRVWDVETQQQVGELIGHLDVTYDLAFSPDGTILASAGGWNDKAIYLWDAKTWEQVGVLGGLSAHVLSIAFSPDGEYLASTVNWDDTVQFWDIETQEREGTFEYHDAIGSGTLSHVAFSPDGKWLACGSEDGIELWELNLPGAAPRTNAFGPKPYDDTVHMDTWVYLEWIAGDFAVSHDVYLGDNFDQVSEATPDSDVFRGNQSATFYVAGLPGHAYPDGLVPGTTYYWRIDEVNDTEPNSPWKGPVWSFTIQPWIAYDPVPADGAESVDLNVKLSWKSGFGAVLHAVYFGDNFDDVKNATGGIKQITTTYTLPGPLESAKTYYWRVDELSGARGGETYKGDIWSFTTTGAVGNPYPLNNATDVEMNAILTWTPADSAVSHQLYFGTDKEAVRNADTSSPEYISSRARGAESYDPGLLEPDTTYYWRVDEVDAQGNTLKGPLWIFTTGHFLLIDDFEGYTDNDADGEAIWQTWVDGFGVADNGAQVGNLMPPYCEQEIVHGGDQSMPLLYVNEAGVTNSEATLPMTVVRDWTQHNLTDLSLWLRGYPGSVGSFIEAPAGTYTMNASGADIWGTADEFHYAFKTLTGPGSIVARVNSIQNTNAWAKAGVMIREMLDAGSKHALACVTPENGVASQGRTAMDGTSFSTNQTGITTPHWVKLERDASGNFTVSHSANGTTWQSVGSAIPTNIPMTSNVYIGLALTSHNAAQACQAVFSNVTITGNVSGQWTHQDVGITTNAAEPMYVELTNANGPSAVVAHEDPASATIDQWTEWIIPLQAFADQGINLNDVDSIAIGLGAKSGIASSGGSGTMYVDDIRLSQP